MTLEVVVIWIIVGLIAGWLASMVVGGGGMGLVGDIVVGIVGAFIGSLIFREMHWRIPVEGLAGTILVAFIGAVVLLLILRLFRRGRAR